MKPSFALNITDTSIGLLHRTARGWLQVGETAFDTADLAEALGYLRGSALGLSPGGLTTKLVLPNSQIKYLELDAPGPEDSDRHSQIRAGLVGRTPYNVEDLVFDWSGSGPKVQVAAVARETLDEAEAFAAEHRFNPVAFVGKPDAAVFKGEPWFGQTKLSATVLEKGEKVDRDAEPVQVANRDLPKSGPAAPAKSATGEPTEDGAANASQDNNTRPTRAQRRAAAAAAEQARLAEAALAVDDVPALSPSAEEASASPAAEDLANAFPEILEKDVEPDTTWSEPELPVPAAAPPVTEAPPVADVSAPKNGTDRPTEPSAPTVTASTAFPEAAGQSPVVDDGAAMQDDLPPAPSAAIMAAFASRRAGEAPASGRFGSSLANPEPARAVLSGIVTPTNRDMADTLAGKSTPPPLSRPKVGGGTATPVVGVRPDSTPENSAMPDAAMARPGMGKPATAFVTAPTIPGSRKRKSLQSDTAGPFVPPEARKSLTKPGGTFASSNVRGKPRYLGWILTGLLLLFLALIAAGSSVFTSDNGQPQTGTAIVSVAETPTPTPAPTPTPEIAADIPAVDDEMLADAQDPAEFDAPTPLAESPVDEAVVPADQATTPVEDAASEETTAPAPAPLPESMASADTALVPPPALEATATAVPEPTPPVIEATPAAPEPAPVGLAISNSPTAAPPSDVQDEIFLTSIDSAPVVLDPLALPPPLTSTDALPVPQLEPPPFGTVYQFDADGRIRPTPEGIITPEGVRLVAGKPGLIPPPRPDDLIAALSAANVPVAAPVADPAATPLLSAPAAANAVASDPALADARPRQRPADLVPPSLAPANLPPPAQQADDDALLSAPGASRVTSLRPLARPATVLAAGEAARQQSAAASLTAQAEQAAAVEAAVQASFQPDENTSRFAISVSRKPAPRPRDMTRAVEAAVAVASRTPDPVSTEVHSEADAEPETASAAPAIPTRASVAKQATYVNAINLSKINLIGVYGSKSSPYALIRQTNGRYKKVKVGDSIDGGRIAAISGSEVRYEKSGRIVSLKMPKT